ncbi:MAG: hypothetical protein ACYC26_06005 [Phycisphaerales bacterium]
MNDENTTSRSGTSDPGRQNHLSVNRRIFFRQIMGLGLDQLDRAGKRIGRRMGDFVENQREEMPQTPPPPMAKREAPGNTQARGANEQSPNTNDE